MTFKKVEPETPTFKSSSGGEDVNSYKFKVEMIVSLFAESELQASTQLDAQGGFIISRDVKLLEVTKIHEEEDK